MPTFRADLHCHSLYSDGTSSPEQLIALAGKNGLSALSITDHDTVDAYRELEPSTEKKGLYHLRSESKGKEHPMPKIAIVSGIEFSTWFQNANIHVLGYRFDPENPAMTALCLKHKTRRQDRNRQMLEKLSSSGLNITEEEVSAGFHRGTIGRPHIALAMIKRGYISTIKEAFEKYLGEGRPCYVQGIAFSIDEAIDTIHEAGGLAVIAHPHLIKPQKLVKALLHLPFDGIECYYGAFSLQVQEQWLKVAKKHNLLVTGGSDFHGDNKPGIDLGVSWVDEKYFDAILTTPSRSSRA